MKGTRKAGMVYFQHCMVVLYGSPPTALSPFAASAITGGDPYKTTMQCWKYTIPAFLVPFIFVLDPSGQGLLLMGSTEALAAANAWEIARVTITAAAGIFALAVGFQGWLLVRATYVERTLLIVAGFALVYPGPVSNLAGVALIVIALASHWHRGWKHRSLHGEGAKT